MIIASTWIKDLANMNVFTWIVALGAIGAITAIAAIVMDGIGRIYKIRVIHHERMVMIEKGMDPGPFVEGSKESQEEDADADAEASGAGAQ